MKIRELTFHSKTEGNWISISDLMSGLMMIFLFIAISYMQTIQEQISQIKEIAVAYEEIQDELYVDLYDEFKDDLKRWNAEIDQETLSIRFNEPKVLFGQGSAEVTQKFNNILHEFFPRYLDILYKDKYRTNIEEVRIEGHTSSEWTQNLSDERAYFLNMALSQSRTCSVLELCIGLVNDMDKREWVRKYITANGLSSSRLVMNEDGTENEERSRRVEFRTKTAAEKKVVEIIERMKKS